MKKHGESMNGISAVALDLARSVGVKAYIYDAITVDEMTEVNKITGIKGIRVPAKGHNLNTRAAALKLCKDKGIDYIAAIESRGFVFGSALACNIGAGLILIRKPGKLPADVVSQEYELEYGTDKIEMHKDAIEEGKKVLLIDDLLATGGTMAAACELIKKVGAIPVACAFVIELEKLNGRDKFDSDIEIVSMLKY